MDSPATKPSENSANCGLAAVRCVGINQIRQDLCFSAGTFNFSDCLMGSCFFLLCVCRVPRGTPIATNWHGQQHPTR